ncbi:MAG TPA: hypothetical protein VGM70_04455 [Pseudolysinimonas sp.]
MNRTRTIWIGDRDAVLREHALAIGGIPVTWILDDARYSDGSRVADPDLREAGIKRRPAYFDEDEDED